MCRHFQKYKSQHSKTLSHIEREESRHFFWPCKLYLHCRTIAGTHNKWTFSKAVRVAGMGLRTVAQSHKMVVGSWSTRHQTQLSSAEQSEHVGHSDAMWCCGRRSALFKGFELRSSTVGCEWRSKAGSDPSREMSASSMGSNLFRLQAALLSTRPFQHYNGVSSSLTHTALGRFWHFLTFVLHIPETTCWSGIGQTESAQDNKLPYFIYRGRPSSLCETLVGDNVLRTLSSHWCTEARTRAKEWILLVKSQYERSK